MNPALTLKPEKEHLLESRHPWIFSGALVMPETPVEPGSLVNIVDAKGKILATGTYSAQSNIAVRVFEFSEAAIDEKWLKDKIQSAHERRLLLGYGPGTDTTGYRVVFGESDGLPGLVVDRYSGVIVVQLTTAGADKLRDIIIKSLIELFKPSAIFERSDIANRKEEGIEERTGTLYGDYSLGDRVEFEENGIKFQAHPISGQKTGFYLDQKDTRKAIREIAEDKDILNLFSYTGSSGVAALMGKARSVLNIDSSRWALKQCHELARLNGIETNRIKTEESDVFQWLNSQSGDKFDMVTMDPPAIIKSRNDIDEGRKAYHFLNRAAMRLVRNGGIFVTSSCSQFFTQEDFATTLRRASVQNGLTLNVLKVIHQSPDHPISIYFPESFYLKSFVCQVG